MRAAIGDIIKLVRPDRIVGFLGNATRSVHEMSGVGKGRGGHEDELGAQRAQRILFLLALRFRHDDDRLVTQRIADQRQTDTGIARRAFDNGAARLQRPLLFRVADDEQGCAILHRCAGVGKFALPVNLASGGFAWPLQKDEWGVADKVQTVWRRFHNPSGSFGWNKTQAMATFRARSSPLHVALQFIVQEQRFVDDA